MIELPSFPIPSEEVGIFVSPKGAAHNAGTRAAPLASIQAAINKATQEKKVVFISTGEYQEEVVSSVSLFGGYSSDFSSYDPTHFVTHITPAKSSHSTTTITLESGSPILRGLYIHGGKSKHTTAVKLLKTNKALLIENDIHGGGHLEGDYSHAVQTSWGNPANFSLIRNKLHGGLNQMSWGIDGLGDSCIVSENIIDGGDGRETWGIRGGGHFLLEQNTIHSGRGTEKAVCLEIYSGGTPQLNKNRFETQSVLPWNAILVGTEANPSLQDNTINGASDAEIFSFVPKLIAQTWRFNEDPSIEKFDAVTLTPWGWLSWWGEDWGNLSGGAHGGAVQSFYDFLGRGPAQETPSNIAAEIRALLLAAGVVGSL
jgi:hypothetical protein